MSTRINCGIRPSPKLLERLVAFDRDNASLLADSHLIPLHAEGEEMQAVVDALKVAFVSDVIHIDTDPQEMPAMFEELEPTVECFDDWWICEVYYNVLSINTIVDGLGSAKALPDVSIAVASLLRRGL